MMMEETFAFSWAAVAVAALAVLAAALWMRWRARARGEPAAAAAAVGAEVRATAEGAVMEGEFGERSFVCRFERPLLKGLGLRPSAGARLAPAAVVLRCRSGRAMEGLSVRRRDFVDRLGALAGLAGGGAVTGDAALDVLCAVEGAQGGHVRTLLTEPAVREALRALFVDGGADGLDVRAGEVEVSYRWSGPRNVDGPWLEGALRALSAVASALEGAGSAEEEAAAGPAAFGRTMALLSLPFAALMAAGLAMALYGNLNYCAADRGELFGAAARHTLPAAAALTLITWAILHRRLRAAPRAAHLFFTAAVLSAAAYTALGTGWFVLSNGLLDDSPRRTYVVKIIARDDAGRYLVVSPWVGRRRPARLPASPRVYDAVEKGDLVAVMTRAGYRGIAWVDAYDFFRDIP
ncbi:MAG TPA: hypothetical protein ENJ37_08585 [Deltaproteobacteria bacterium]|nr:hypothetical protein [Deltaproteobacteria bacterium]